MNQYMEGGQKDSKLEDRIKLLKAFLESMDFRKLRNQSERYLIEGKRVKFAVLWENRNISYEMVVIRAAD